MNGPSNSLTPQSSYQAERWTQESRPDIINQVEQRTESSKVLIQFLEPYVAMGFIQLDWTWDELRGELS